LAVISSYRYKDTESLTVHILSKVMVGKP